ncbi:CARDB domain-containing protein [Oleomonas cavernae]|uniref:CARDB domain-containing protein n=1 Tax=Oleomonas cavernae TaxID=2320859 RepID=UPI001314CCCE|nr:CARDB domain-containing protein [Oleomonas cavernae]
MQLPDLDVQNAGDSYPPTLSASSVVAGGSVTLTYRLSNFGTGSAPSSVTGIYRSTDGTISTGDTRIGTDSNGSLAANSGSTETFTIDTSGWTPGSYYIGAVADYNNAISESNEGNNPSSGVWLTVTAPPVQLPDLDVQNAGDSYPPTLSASSIVAGGSVTLTYRLSNFGTGSAPSSVTGIYRSSDSTISTSDTRVGTDSNGSLAADTGRTETFTVDTTGWAAGSYYIGAVADYNNAISESNESNNPSSGVWLTVTAPPVQLPDLDVQNAGDSYPPTLSASSVVAGGSVTLTYRLSNFGTGSAPSSVTGIYRSTDGAISTGDTRIGTDSNASLAANTGRTETFTVDTTGWAAGSYYIGAVADYANAISESNESNNPSSGVWLTVTAPPVQLPDLDVQNAGDSYPPTLSASSVVAGGGVTLTYRLSNFGTGSAPSSVTGIYRSSDSTISTSDTRVGTDSNGSLAANTGRTETFTIDTTGWAAGSYYIGAVADYNKAISESNESNNPSSGVRLTVTAAPTTPEVTVLGNAVSIADGDTTPVATDHTNFGSVEVGSAGVTRTFTVRNDGGGTLNLSNLTLPTGFTLVNGLVTSLAPGATDTFRVRMDAATAGTKTGQITFASNDPNESAFNFVVTGTVTGMTTDAGNTLATATDLTLGNTVLQSVGSSPDSNDFFHFTAASSGHVTANLTGLSADLDIRALNSSGTQIVAGELEGNSSESISFNVTAGQVYYLHVDPFGVASSNYRLATTFISGAASATEMLAEARSHLGEDYYWRYRLNADGSRTYTTFNSTTINDADFSGPWDCAEFVSYCIYQETGNRIGLADPSNPSSFEFSSAGWKYAIANELGVTQVTLQTALETVGAVIWIEEHVMMSVGNGYQIIEASARKSSGKYFSDDRTVYYDPLNKSATPGVVWDTNDTASVSDDTPMGVDIGDVTYHDYTASELEHLHATAGVVDAFLI